MSAEEPPRYTASSSAPPRLRPQLSAASCGVGVLVTGVVYWVAASHANVLARHAVRQMPLDWSEIRAILSQGWPMVSRGSLEKPGYGQFSEVFGPDPDTLNDDRIGRAL